MSLQVFVGGDHGKNGLPLRPPSSVGAARPDAPGSPPEAAPASLAGRRRRGPARVRPAPIGGGAVGSPRLSAGSSIPSNTAAKTASNTGTCSRAETSTTRQVQ